MDPLATETLATAAILAGGASSRMGTDKARLEVAGIPLIARVAESLIAADVVLEEIVVVGGSEALVELIPSPVRWVPDRWPNEGPLGAVITALAHVIERNHPNNPAPTTSDVGLVLTAACDLVSVHPHLINLLAHEAVRTDADVCVPLVGDQHQWHLAMWHPRAISTLSEAFTDGVRSLHQAVVQLRHLEVVESPLGVELDDLDTVDDVARYTSTATSRAPSLPVSPTASPIDENDVNRP